MAQCDRPYYHFLLMVCSNNVQCVSKNVPPLSCYNLDTQNPIMIIFGRSVTKKARNQIMLCFPVSHI